MDFSSYKFRCSGLRHLMTNGRKKDEVFGETSKAYLRELFIKEVYGRDRSYQTITKYTTKGTMVESDSLDLVHAITGEAYFKNQTRLENEFITGTPDLILEDRVIDIKSSWDIFTFAGTDAKKAGADYFYQLLGYMWLTGKTQGELWYCLNNTPDILINDEIYRLSFKMPEEEAEKYRINFTFDDIPAEKKLKKFPFVFEQESITALTERIKEARKYLSTLDL